MGKARLLISEEEWNRRFGRKKKKKVDVPQCDKSAASVEGILCNAGKDFIDVLLQDDTVVTILRQRINKIHWIDRKCNPCHSHPHHHDSGPGCNADHRHCCQRHDIHYSHRCDCDNHCSHCSRINHHHHDHCATCCPHHHSLAVCDERLRLRLAGLTDQLSFQLFRLRGCRIRVECS